MADRFFDPVTGCYVRETAGRDGTDGTNNDDSISRQFLVYDNTDPLVCRNALLNLESSLTLFEFANLPLGSLSWKLQAGSTKWSFTASYAQVPPLGGYTISIDTTGGTGKQTEAFTQQKFDATGEDNAREYGTTVNVQNNEPQGVDRVLPALKLNINAKVKSSLIGDPITYSKTLANLTGSVNNATYLTFAAGELLFLGASGNIVGEDPTLTYTFSASSNLTNWSIGPITGVTKNGHDYIWFDYKSVKDPNSNLKISKPRAAYVAKVYTYADFSVLRIGD